MFSWSIVNSCDQYYMGDNMNKLELVSALKKEANISNPEAARIVAIFFDSMSGSLVSGERV